MITPEKSSGLPSSNNQLFDFDDSFSAMRPKKAPCYTRIPFFKQLCIILFIQVSIFLFFFFCVSKDQTLIMLQTAEAFFTFEYSNNLPTFMGIYFVLCSLSISLVFPTISILVILFTVVSKSIIFSWSVTLVCYLVTESLMYFFVNKYFKGRIDRYVQNFGYLN